jgi:glucose/arabinose dehydrogenase
MFHRQGGSKTASTSHYKSNSTRVSAMRRSEALLLLVATLITAAFQFHPVYAQQNDAPVQRPSAKNSLSQNFLVQHEIGRRFRIDPAELPAPKSSAIVTNRALTVPYNGQTLQVPPGFTATPFATGLVNPRQLLVLPNGDVLVAEQSAGYLTLLRDDGTGKAIWIGAGDNHSRPAVRSTFIGA